MLVIKNLKNDKVVIASSEMQVINTWLNARIINLKEKLFSEIKQPDKFNNVANYDYVQDVLRRREHYNSLLLGYNRLYDHINNMLFNHRVNDFKTDAKPYTIKELEVEVYTVDQDNLGII